jgi:predicted AAA+ superfamily ATPase
MTVDGYIEILEDTLLAYRLPAYEARLRVRERKHPKLYWIDPGLVRAIKKQFAPVSAEERGPLLEGWVLTLLRAYSEERRLFDEIYFWAPTAAKQVEVDFLLKRDRKLLAIEVKSQKRFSTSLLSGLKAIGELPNVVRRILAYRGTRDLKTSDGIDVWTIDTLVRAVDSGQLWP